MNYEVISMNMSNNPEFVSVIRLTTSGIATRMGFNLEDIEDLKVATSEACTNAIKHSKKEEFQIKFKIFRDKLVIEVKDDGVGCDLNTISEPDLKNPKTSGLGLFIIKALMDEVEVESCEDSGTVIKITKMVGVEN